MARNKMDRRTLESQFERLPNDIVYKIFGKCGWKELMAAKSVCREWEDMLSLSTMQKLATSYGIPSSPSYLLNINYVVRTNTAKKEIRGDLVAVDLSGRCTVPNIMISTKLDFDPDWVVTSHEFVFIFATLKTHGYITVINPSLKWATTIPFEFGERGIGFIRGAYYDPATSRFGILIGISRTQRRRIVDGTIHLSMRSECSYKIYIYCSESKQWQSLYRQISSHAGVYLDRNTALYSKGCYYWVNNLSRMFPKKQIITFSLCDLNFKSIEMPVCEAHLGICHSVRPPRAKLWKVDESNGDVVLLHWLNNIVGAWRLLEGENGVFQWSYFEITRDMDRRGNIYFASSESGWLWEGRNVWDKKPRFVEFLDGQGKLLFSRTLPDMLSSTPGGDGEHEECHLIGAWFFETNNIWNVLAAS